MFEGRYRLIPAIMFFFLLPARADSQLCTGSLGDPIVNVTFGQGPNPGAPLLAAATNYQYITTDCPADGFYTVANTTNACFGNSWHSLTGDHTGNTGGYFMLVNASFQPGAFYIDTVRGLCQGTVYELAAWIINVLRPSACSGNGIRPNISFTVEKTDGTVIQSYNTGDISSTNSSQWNKYGFFFSTPASVNDVVLRLVNNAPGGCGNDLALDDITFRACGPAINFTIDNLNVSEVHYCEGPAKQFVFNAIASGGFTSPVYQWQRKDPGASVWIDIPAATANNYIMNFPANSLPGLYQFRIAVAESGNISSAGCRVYSSLLKVIVEANPVTMIINNGPVCTGQIAKLQASGGNTFSWSGPAGFTGNSPIELINNTQPFNAGRYYSTITTAAGCAKRDSTDLVVNPVPTAVVAFDDSTICIGKTIQLFASGGNSYEWKPTGNLSDPASPSPFASPIRTLDYIAIVTNSSGCTDTAVVHINVIQAPQVSAGPDKIIFTGQAVQLQGLASTGDIYSWSPNLNINNPAAIDPIVSPMVDQKYALTVVSSYGCGMASDTVLIKVFNDIFIPTAFTPNNNGRNDEWNVLGIGALKSFKVSVFNRWGQRVFYTVNEEKGWDGKFKGQEQPAGTYIYYIETGGFRPVLKGSLLLIR